MIVITTMNALPEYCYDCPCHNGENGQCRADANGRYVAEYRPYWCPLKDTAEETKSCYYECIVGCEPNKEECKKKHPNGCDSCDWFLEDPSPENGHIEPTGTNPDDPF